MGFKELYEHKIEFENLMLMIEEDATEEEKTDLEAEGKKSGVFSKISFMSVLKAIGIGKGKLNTKETKKSLKMLGKILTAIDGITSVFRGGGGGGGGKGSTGGGIFTSILRYNNPILKKIVPEKASLDSIEELLGKMDFKADHNKIYTMSKFRVLFTTFLKENPIPDVDTYNYLHDTLSGIKDFKNVVQKQIRPDAFVPGKIPKTKETLAAKKKRLAADKKGLADEKKVIEQWTIDFKKFLQNDYWSSEVHTTMAPLFQEFAIQLKMNTEEIKADLSKLFSTIFSREVLQFMASLTKVGKNFFLVVISVYLMKIIKAITFK
jgi:hypothetical protein